MAANIGVKGSILVYVNLGGNMRDHKSVNKGVNIRCCTHVFKCLTNSILTSRKKGI